MALTKTTLSAAVGVNDKSIVVASATGFAAGNIVRIDGEYMLVSKAYVSGTTITLDQRGIDGSAQVAHVVTANVLTGLATDFAQPVPGGAATIAAPQRPVLLQSITATSTLTLPPPGCDLRVILNGTSVITLTIPVPTQDLDFCRLTILANGVAAHVLSFTGGIGGAGASYVKWTNNATAPSGFEVMACNGLWVGITTTPAAGTVTNITGTVSA